MKFLLAMALGLFGACAAWAATSLEQSFTCPIDAETWKQRIETSTRPTGLRLDLKKLGDVVEPPTLPQCPKCRYVLFNERLEEAAMRKVKAFVLGGDYQAIAAKSPAWACLAQIQEFLGAPPVYSGFSYLRASWQVEEKPGVSRRYLSRAYEQFGKAAKDLPAGHKDRLNILLLLGELERRLERWREAEDRFRNLLVAEEFKDEPRLEPIATLQLKLIEAKDSGPRALGGTDRAPAAKAEPLQLATPETPQSADSPAQNPGRKLDFSKPLLMEGASSPP